MFKSVFENFIEIELAINSLKRRLVSCEWKILNFIFDYDESTSSFDLKIGSKLQVTFQKKIVALIINV